MKTYRMSFAASIDHKPEYPERTAKRSSAGMDFDVTFQVWPNRAAMLKTCDIQARASNKATNWRPCITREEMARNAKETDSLDVALATISEVLRVR